MKRSLRMALGAILLTGTSAASAQGLTDAQARATIAPWYGLFNVASRGDVKTIQEQVLTADYESCSGYLPSECWGRDTSIKVVGNFAKSSTRYRRDAGSDELATVASGMRCLWRPFAQVAWPQLASQECSPRVAAAGSRARTLRPR